MLRLTVLSPHRDDAAFSLCLTLLKWNARPLSVTVLNYFTVSEYAPRALYSTREQISELRRREDEKALRQISPAITVHSFGLLDAPIRLGISAKTIANSEVVAQLTTNDIQELTKGSGKFTRTGLVLAPLALGNHVDHVAVWSAANSSQIGTRLGFYEDLPYVTWTPQNLLRQRIGETERATGLSLKPFIVRNGNSAEKSRIINQYQSQISPEEANCIARFSNRYGGGERLWLPRFAKLWRELI